MPPLGAPAAVDLFPEFADGLLRFEKHSHIWVMAWLDGAERDVLQVTPRGVRDRGPDGLHGVFSVRSPARPNPIGLTAARVLRVEGTRMITAVSFTVPPPVRTRYSNEELESRTAWRCSRGWPSSSH